MQNAQQTYNITFIWKERIYKDSDTQLHCGSMRFEFNVDVRDFVEGNIENLILLLYPNEYPEKLVKSLIMQ
uniref:Uncharacterized protein n=1 Tax=Rhizophagus irregularis (strain DAOM 181602 / DAOM 197198 / MUCL 43194) TaxID=747089 RepID=U9UK17_RHIID